VSFDHYCRFVRFLQPLTRNSVIAMHPYNYGLSIVQATDLEFRFVQAHRTARRSSGLPCEFRRPRSRTFPDVTFL
jgi:hypothetical protein